jgi:parallel beta-helix repeat protein
MRKVFFIIALLLSGPNQLHAACAADGSNWNSTPDYSSVSSCISQADEGDTITVSAGDGSETWSSSLAITKGLYIIGPGESSLTITSSYTGDYLITYNPATPSNNPNFRLSGFTFDCNNNTSFMGWIDSFTTPQTNIRIDNNTIQNATYGFEISGLYYGVIDNNTMSNVNKFFSIMGNNTTAWNNVSFSPGGSQNLYIEDNTCTDDDTTNPISHGGGGLSVFRFNTFTDNSASNGTNAYDMHGNQDGGNFSTIGCEVYGNTFNKLNGYNLDKGIYHRGGEGLFWGNNFVVQGITNGGVSVNEEYNDALYPSANSYTQKVHNSYYWSNVRNGSITVSVIDGMDYYHRLNQIVNDPEEVIEDREFWVEDASFDGTSGIGVGVLASRPSTCTTGVGYWATDQGSWNQEGDDGVLYKCTSTDTWEVYYTPYTYPHPLRDEAGTTPSASGITFSGVTIGQ